MTVSLIALAAILPEMPPDFDWSLLYHLASLLP